MMPDNPPDRPSSHLGEPPEMRGRPEALDSPRNQGRKRPPLHEASPSLMGRPDALDHGSCTHNRMDLGVSESDGP
ncbi:hypothetical protein VTN77DRAFT_670 [Rasamsonia byssochlamydoides]|uniref:uncharacterized protein n=1 Tax=Rasamsonia byssochlamydoides TaxID=89139 RepID=UPI00374419A4